MSIVLTLPLKRPSSPSSPPPPPKVRRIMHMKVIDIPFTRSVKYYQQERAKRPRANFSFPQLAPIPSTPQPLSSPRRPLSRSSSFSFPTPSRSSTTRPLRPNLNPKHIIQPQSQRQRQTSPLSPGTPSLLPARPTFPKSKPKPDFLRAAIKACMKRSPEGRSLLKNGPRKAAQFLASSPQEQVNAVINATKDLERIIDDMVMRTFESDDGSWDVDMDGEIPGLTASTSANNDATPAPAPPPSTTTGSSLTKSWVDIGSEPDTDWEILYG